MIFSKEELALLAEARRRFEAPRRAARKRERDAASRQRRRDLAALEFDGVDSPVFAQRRFRRNEPTFLPDEWMATRRQAEAARRREVPAPYIRFSEHDTLVVDENGGIGVTDFPADLPPKALTSHEWIYMHCLEPSDERY